MSSYGFFRVAAAVPRVRVGDCGVNLEAICELLAHAQRNDVELAVFPELSLTGYTCADLFFQPALLEAARESLIDLAKQSKSLFEGVIVVGLPIEAGDKLFNAAAVIHNGQIAGIIPKSYLPNYREFY